MQKSELSSFDFFFPIHSPRRKIFSTLFLRSLSRLLELSLLSLPLSLYSRNSSSSFPLDHKLQHSIMAAVLEEERVVRTRRRRSSDDDEDDHDDADAAKPFK